MNFELTPIEEYNGILFKRDDKFRPFADLPLNGGKIRQALMLLERNQEKIEREHGGVVATAGGVNSPQGIIITRSAIEFGFKTILAFGGKTPELSIKNNKLVRIAHDLGAKIVISGIGYDVGLVHMLKKDYPNAFLIKFGINLDSDPDAIIGAIADQCENIPHDLDMLVIPVGSGLSMAAILVGLDKFDIRPKRVIGIQIAGYDRRKTITEIAPFLADYEFYSAKDFKYAYQLKLWLNDTEMLDPLYEAKAMYHFKKNFDFKYKRVLFWIVGNTTQIRRF